MRNFREHLNESQMINESEMIQTPFELFTDIQNNNSLNMCFVRGKSKNTLPSIFIEKPIINKVSKNGAEIVSAHTKFTFSFKEIISSTVNSLGLDTTYTYEFRNGLVIEFFVEN